MGMDKICSNCACREVCFHMIPSRTQECKLWKPDVDQIRLGRIHIRPDGSAEVKLRFGGDRYALVCADLMDIPEGVTIYKCDPVVPDYDYEYRISEMSYNNGYAKGLEDGKPKWRPASEPPKEWEDENGGAINFQIFAPGIGVDIGNWIEPIHTWFCLGAPFNVTHWMPLPEPPQE